MRCLEKEPADRFPRVRELAEHSRPMRRRRRMTCSDDSGGTSPAPSQMGPARAATPQRNGPRTEATPAPVVRPPSTVALESGPALVARGGSDHAMHAMPPMQHGYSQPPAPMPSAPGMPSSPSLPPMPMMTNGPGAPPVTRYAVSADPVTNGGPAASRGAWGPAAVAAFAVLATLAGGLAYRAAHRAARPRPSSLLRWRRSSRCRCLSVPRPQSSPRRPRRRRSRRPRLLLASPRRQPRLRRRQPHARALRPARRPRRAGPCAAPRRRPLPTRRARRPGES